MVCVERFGEPGNWLFQYCFGRILATRFRYRLRALPLLGFPGTFSKVYGEEIVYPTSVWEGQWPFDSLVGRPIERGELRKAPAAKLILRGHFQRYEFLSEHREEIRSDWLRLPKCDKRAPREMLVCLDSVFSENSLSTGEIQRLVSATPHGELHFWSNNVSDSFLEEATKFGAEIHTGHSLEFLLLAKSFKKIAFGQSALYWWGAFLSDAEEIYFPKCKRGDWVQSSRALNIAHAIHHGVDLRVDDPRYIYNW